MSRDNYIQKIKLLDYLDVGIWVKKKQGKAISHKVILVSDLIKKQHSIILESFIKAIKKNDSKIRILVQSESEIKNLIIENNDNKSSKFLLIFCSEELIEYFKNISRKKIIFSNLFSSDNITNQSKKFIWEEFLKFKDYE